MKYSQDIKQEALSRYKCGSYSVKNIIEDLNVSAKYTLLLDKTGGSAAVVQICKAARCVSEEI